MSNTFTKIKKKVILFGNADETYILLKDNEITTHNTWLRLVVLLQKSYHETVSNQSSVNLLWENILFISSIIFYTLIQKKCMKKFEEEQSFCHL